MAEGWQRVQKAGREGDEWQIGAWWGYQKTGRQGSDWYQKASREGR